MPIPEGQIGVGGLLVPTFFDGSGNAGKVIENKNIDGAAAFEVNGDVLTITYQDASGTTQTVDFSGGVTVERSIAVGWSDDTTVTAAELTATAMADHVRIPDRATDGYLAFWASNDSGVVQSVNIGSGADELNTFGTPSALTVGSEAGMVYVSSAQRSGTLLSSELMRMSFGPVATPMVTRYLAVGPDNVFTEADFLAGVVSMTNMITEPVYTVNSYLAFASPATNPISSITSPGALPSDLTNFFTRGPDLTISGVAYYSYISTIAFLPNPQPLIFTIA